MGDTKKGKQKRCAYCGRFFTPDYRVGERQKSCQHDRCRQRRKKESQRRCAEANPGYFRGRYENTRRWRQNHPKYQRLWRAKRREIQDEISSTTPVKTVRLVVPVKWLKGEIQDEIRLAAQFNNQRWAVVIFRKLQLRNAKIIPQRLNPFKCILYEAVHVVNLFGSG